MNLLSQLERSEGTSCTIILIVPLTYDAVKLRKNCELSISI
jgi:hypothetical protein